MCHGTVLGTLLVVYQILRTLTSINRLCDATIMLDLNALSTPVNKCFPLDPASLEEEIEEKKATDNIFYVHAELVETASVLFLRQIASGNSSIAVPGEDRDVIQLFARFLYSNNIHSNLVDACAVTGGYEIINLKLRDDSFVQLHMPDDEEKLLAKAYLFGYSYSCWTFCDAIIDTLICKIIDEKRTPVLHSLLDLDSSDARFYPLKMLVAHLAIYTWTDGQLRGFALAHKFDRIDHVKFWADVGGYNAMHKSSILGLPKAPWKKDPCHYHVHSLYLKMKYDCYTHYREIAQSSASHELDGDWGLDD
jgi:hypothetical protein